MFPKLAPFTVCLKPIYLLPRQSHQNQIEKTVIAEGTFGRKPTLGWKCVVKLKREDSITAELESDYLKSDVSEIIIGNGNWPVDRAIESCLETMYLLERSVFHVILSPGVEIRLNIAFESCVEEDYIFEWTDEAKLKASKSYKEDGINLFKSNRIEQAFFKFSKALKMLLLIDSSLNAARQSEENNFVSLYNNLANCHFHYKNYSHVIELCNRSLDIKPNVKGYFRRAMAYIELKLYDNAENDLTALMKIEPNNKAAIEKYKLVRQLNKANRDNYETIVRNMFR